MSYLKKYINSWLFLGSLVFFFLSFILGGLASNEIEILIDPSKELTNNPFYYLRHNLKSSLYLFGGIITFSISTIWSLVLNGFMLGATFTGVIAEKSFLFALGSIFFHGIFEIPAITIAGAVGLYPCYIIIKMLKKGKIPYLEHLKRIIIMIVCSIMLFTVAAFMEAYVSPLIINII